MTQLLQSVLTRRKTAVTNLINVEELIAYKSNQNKFKLNESKCKELRISFAKSAADFAPIVINGKAIER